MNQYQVQKRLLEKSNNSNDPFDMSNYVGTGFTLNNVRKNMFVTDGGEDLTIEEKAQKITEQIDSYDDPQSQQLEEIARKTRIKKQDEEYQKKKNMGYLEYFWNILKSPFQMYDVAKKAKALDYIKKRAKDGVDIAVEKVTDNPVVNTISGLFKFLRSIIQYWYLYIIGLIGLFIFIKKI